FCTCCLLSRRHPPSRSSPPACAFVLFDCLHVAQPTHTHTHTHTHTDTLTPPPSGILEAEEDELKKIAGIKPEQANRLFRLFQCRRGHSKYSTR
ncbi:MAG: hypothetical protein ACPIOQ_65535, partial [Promethearchaeia archaeon]